MPLQIVRNDITTMKVDAIVNAAEGRIITMLRLLMLYITVPLLPMEVISTFTVRLFLSVYYAFLHTISSTNSEIVL